MDFLSFLQMGIFKNKYRVESTRLEGYDYSNPAWYYVTICTKGMKEWFGKVENAKMILNHSGKITSKLFEEIPDHFENVKVDYFVIMPNHVHGIIIIEDFVETRACPPTEGPRFSTTTIW